MLCIHYSTAETRTTRNSFLELGVRVTTLKYWKKNREELKSHSESVEGKQAVEIQKIIQKLKPELDDNAL